MAPMRCVVPQAKMKTTNNQKTLGKGRSRRRNTKYAITIGMAVYAPKMARSDKMCSQPNLGSCCQAAPQDQRGGKPCVSNKRMRKSNIATPDPNSALVSPGNFGNYS